MTSPFSALTLAALSALGDPAPDTLPLVQVQAMQFQSGDLASQLRQYVAFCAASAKAEYVVDCLAERFNVAADGLGRTGDTAELNRALKEASHDLAAVSRKYASATTAPLVLQTSAFTTTRPIRPVAPDDLRPSNAAATAVLEEAELSLLRSSTRSPNALAFSQVAEIVGSAKVLLRAG